MFRVEITSPLTLFFFFFFNTKYFNTHTYKEMRESLKETDNDVYPKESNSWIHNTNFKHL